MSMQDYIDCDLLPFRVDIIEKIVERFSCKSWEFPKKNFNEEEKEDTRLSSEELPELHWKRLTPKKRRKIDNASVLDAREPEASVDPLLTDVDWENFELQGEEFNLPSSNTKNKFEVVDSMLVDEENTKESEGNQEKPAEKALD